MAETENEYIQVVRHVASVTEMDNLILSVAAHRPRLAQPGEGVEAYWLRVVGWLELPKSIEVRKELRTELEEQLFNQFFLDCQNLTVSEKYRSKSHVLKRLDNKDKVLRNLYTRLANFLSLSKKDRPGHTEFTLQKARREAQLIGIGPSIEQFLEGNILQGEQIVLPIRDYAKLNSTTAGFRDNLEPAAQKTLCQKRRYPSEER